MLVNDRLGFLLLIGAGPAWLFNAVSIPLLTASGLIFPAAIVVVAIAAEIINAAMIWRNLFVFIQPFKPSAPRQVAAVLSVGATRTSLLRAGLLFLTDCIFAPLRPRDDYLQELQL